jgi:hypothetical protein
MSELSKEESLVLFKNLIIEMAMRVAALEKILIDKNLVSLDEIAAADESLKDEAKNVISNKK